VASKDSPTATGEKAEDEGGNKNQTNGCKKKQENIAHTLEGKNLAVPALQEQRPWT